MEKTESLMDQHDPKVQELYGRIREAVLPSGNRIVIREQNGDDDDTLSNQHTSKDGSNFNYFIAGIVVKTDFTETGKLTVDDVKKLKLRDKYFIIFLSRIHSLGSEIRFTYNWGEKEGGVKHYVEDLEQYIWDYNKPVPEKGQDNYFSERIQKYELVEKGSKGREIELSSGKVVKYEYLTVESEKRLLELPQDKISKNTELKARNIHLTVDDKWIKVESFKRFSSKDMAEIRKDVATYDAPFTGFTELENPVTGDKINIPIISSADFFYPEEI